MTTPLDDAHADTAGSSLLTCTCGTNRDDEVVITLDGELDLSSAPLLRELLAAAQQLTTSVVLDVAGLTFLDSSGINEIARANQHGTLRIRHASPLIQRTLDICGFRELLEDDRST